MLQELARARLPFNGDGTLRADRPVIRVHACAYRLHSRTHAHRICTCTCIAATCTLTCIAAHMHTHIHARQHTVYVLRGSDAVQRGWRALHSPDIFCGRGPTGEPWLEMADQLNTVFGRNRSAEALRKQLVWDKGVRLLMRFATYETGVLRVSLRVADWLV